MARVSDPLSGLIRDIINAEVKADIASARVAEAQEASNKADAAYRVVSAHRADEIREIDPGADVDALVAGMKAKDTERAAKRAAKATASAEAVPAAAPAVAPVPEDENPWG